MQSTAKATSGDSLTLVTLGAKPESYAEDCASSSFYHDREKMLTACCISSETASSETYAEQLGCLQAEAEALEAIKDVKISPRSSAKPDEVKKKGRKISAKCWMATKFPMSLRQLLPVMDVIGHANKHLAKVTKFLRKYGDMELFPVKFQVFHAHRLGYV